MTTRATYFFVCSPGFAAAPVVLFVRQWAFTSLPALVLLAATHVHPGFALQAVSSRPLHLEATLWVTAGAVAGFATCATVSRCACVAPENRANATVAAETAVLQRANKVTTVISTGCCVAA